MQVVLFILLLAELQMYFYLFYVFCTLSAQNLIFLKPNNSSLIDI